jgi:hypothetical protein
MMTSDTPIQRLPHGRSQTAVRKIAREKRARDLVSILDFHFWKNATYTQVITHARYIRDHIAKVTPVGVTEVANIAEMSACVMPPMRYGEPGILTSEVSPIVMRAAMRRRYRIMRGKG